MGFKKNDLREHSRIPIRSKVKVNHPSLGEFDAFTADLSDGGLFITSEKFQSAQLDDQLTVQSLDMAANAPLLEVKIVRITDEGAAVAFINRD